MSRFCVGVIGCGQVGDVHFRNLAGFKWTDFAVCACLDQEDSDAKAALRGIARSCTTDEIYAALNLTTTAAHAEVTLRVPASGKHVYAEKPLADGARILQLAAGKGLVAANAPNTFLGGHWQTVRKLLDSGVIGEPASVTAFAGTHGAERRHPNPDLYYLEGGGPLLELGPHYLTAMFVLLRPIARVAGFERRMIENGPRSGKWMPVEVDTHAESMFEFRSGATGSLTVSFDVRDSETPRFWIRGTDGSLTIPDPDPVHGPNAFGGAGPLQSPGDLPLDARTATPGPRCVAHRGQHARFQREFPRPRTSGISSRRAARAPAARLGGCGVPRLRGHGRRAGRAETWPPCRDRLALRAAQAASRGRSAERAMT